MGFLYDRKLIGKKLMMTPEENTGGVSTKLKVPGKLREQPAYLWCVW